MRKVASQIKEKESIFVIRGGEYNKDECDQFTKLLVKEQSRIKKEEKAKKDYDKPRLFVLPTLQELLDMVSTARKIEGIIMFDKNIKKKKHKKRMRKKGSKKKL